MNNPLVSVIMSVYNGEKYLRESIESILGQTFKDFEFIIINDGSTDKSENIIKSFNDPRIKLISRSNKGLVASLNEGIEKSLGKYIARMDSDDISESERLEKQINFLKSNPDISVVGSWAKKINENSQIIEEMNYPPAKNKEIKKYSLFHNPFIHPSIMFKKEIIKKIGLYNPFFKNAEDYEFWSRVLASFQVANLPLSLLRYRINQAGITRSRNMKMRAMSLLARLLILARVFFRLPI